MELEEFATWKEAVALHMDTLDAIITDRKILKNSMEDHLKMCFEWDEIEYNRDFSIITLKWTEYNTPIIHHDKICQLNMDWSIESNYDDEIIIKVYPFGIKEDDNSLY